MEFSTAFSPKGALHDSPGQRPGFGPRSESSLVGALQFSRLSTAFSPEGALHDSPGQRPGFGPRSESSLVGALQFSRLSTAFSPEGALHDSPGQRPGFGPRSESSLVGALQFSRLSTAFSPKGALHDSPGQRPGFDSGSGSSPVGALQLSRLSPAFSPEGALHDSPGQRPGYVSENGSSPVRAAQNSGHPFSDLCKSCLGPQKPEASQPNSRWLRPAGRHHRFSHQNRNDPGRDRSPHCDEPIFAATRSGVGLNFNPKTGGVGPAKRALNHRLIGFSFLRNDFRRGLSEGWPASVGISHAGITGLIYAIPLGLSAGKNSHAAQCLSHAESMSVNSAQGWSRERGAYFRGDLRSGAPTFRSPFQRPLQKSFWAPEAGGFPAK